MLVLINVLKYLGYILIFPGFLFCFICGLLLCGIDRIIMEQPEEKETWSSSGGSSPWWP